MTLPEDVKYIGIKVNAAPFFHQYLDFDNITLTNDKRALPCDYLFLIPQSKEDLTLTVNYTVDGGTETSHTFELSDAWEAGTEYIVNISMGTSIIK